MTMPRIIAGPILRRVDPRSVSVWVACSQQFHLTLKLYQGDGLKATGSATGISTVPAPEIPTTSAESAMVKFGKHLWIAVVTAKPQVSLQSSLVYSYNIHFQSPDTPSLSMDLRTDGLLKSGTHEGRKQEPLGYKANVLPTFVLPNDDPEKLFVAQASCRKIHGHGEDALANLDKIIGDNIAKVDKRPQQLFMTGDQVYADDVPGPLLRFISVIDGFGIGADDKVKVDKPDGSTGEFEAGISIWPPYLRQHLMKNAAGFTSGSARNHVISFSEFCGLYLSCWNLRSWNIDLVNEVKKVQADNKDSVVTEVATSLLDSEAVEDDPNLKGIYANDEGISRDGFELALSDSTRLIFVPASSSAADRQAQEEKFDAWIEGVRGKLKSELKRMAVFAAALPKVARVMANVPCYMIFDDHEVTDDWYMTQRWKNQVLSKNLGRDIIRNGLMAYAVFQDWGNVPDEYVAIPSDGTPGSSPTPRTRLIRKIADFCHASITTPDSPTLRTDIVEPIETLLGLGGSASEVKWHYSVRTGPTTTFVLDTRTRREYPSLNAPPRLISQSALEEQIPATNPVGTAPFVIVISPAPAPGLASFEELVQPAVASITGLSHPDGPNPGFLEGMADVDFEAWGFNVPALEALLKRLSLHKNVIVFSGDVHYGFSSVLDYWKGNATTPAARIVTFTSSAAKNESAGLLHLYRSALIQKLLTGLSDQIEKLGWENRVLSVSGPASIRNRHRLRQNPAVIPVAGWQAGSTVNRAPDFRWRLRVLTDESVRSGDAVTADPVLTNPTSMAQGYENVVQRHLDNFVSGVHRRMVWPSNVGLLTFEGTGAALKAKHDFLFAAGSRSISTPKPGTHIKHETDLSASGPDAVRPELP
jgi:hypothetical protein